MREGTPADRAWPGRMEPPNGGRHRTATVLLQAPSSPPRCPNAAAAARWQFCPGFRHSPVLDMPLHCALDELRSVVQIKLGANVLAMGVDGVHTDVQLLSTLPRALASADQLENLQLTISQCFGPAVRHLAANRLRDEALSHGDAQISLASKHRAKRFHHLALQLLFVDVAQGTCTQGTLGKEGFVVSADHEHPGVHACGDNSLDQVDAVSVPESDIHYG